MMTFDQRIGRNNGRNLNVAIKDDKKRELMEIDAMRIPGIKGEETRFVAQKLGTETALMDGIYHWGDRSREQVADCPILLGNQRITNGTLIPLIDT
jgi:hypothetical protein